MASRGECATDDFNSDAGPGLLVLYIANIHMGVVESVHQQCRDAGAAKFRLLQMNTRTRLINAVDQQPFGALRSRYGYLPKNGLAGSGNMDNRPRARATPLQMCDLNAIPDDLDVASARKL